MTTSPLKQRSPRALASALVISILLGLVAACAPAAPAPRTIRLPMGYIPSVQYANFYVAVEKGYFKEAGIDIEFDYSFETNGVQLVGANQLPFAVVSGEQVLLARAQGLPVVFVMGWFQKFPVAVISKKTSRIIEPADLRGKRIGVPTLDGANFIGLRALLAKAGVAPEEATIQAIGFNQVAALTADQVDAVVVYSNNEPIRLAAQDQTPNVIEVSDWATLAANGLMTNEDTIKTNPDLVRAFVKAMVRGTEYVIANPAESYEISKKYIDNLTDDAVEKRVLEATIKLWEAEKIGSINPDAWNNMHTVLLNTGLLSQPLDVQQAYTNDFVP